MQEHEHEFDADIQDGRVYCEHPGCHASQPISDADAIFLMFGGVTPDPPRPALRLVP